MAVALVFAPTALAEPVTVQVGDPSVDGRIITGYHNAWRLMGRAADGGVIQMGVWTDDTRIDTIDGREVIVRRQAWVHERGAEGYFNVLDHRTLAPVLSQYTNAGGLYRRMEYSADGRGVRYQLAPVQTPDGAMHMTQPAAQGEVATPSPLFDFNTGTFGLLLVGFPLAEGYSARFPVFRSYDPKSEPAWIDFAVEGRETVTLLDGRHFDTWRVVAHSPDTDETMTFNLIKQAPYVIELRQAWNGRDWTFEMM